jgi:hypothetical protein
MHPTLPTNIAGMIREDAVEIELIKIAEPPNKNLLGWVAEGLQRPFGRSRNSRAPSISAMRYRAAKAAQSYFS